MSDLNPMFRSEWGESIFRQKYPLFSKWEDLATQLAHEVCDGLLPKSQIEYIAELIRDMKFIPGGRYLYYAGRKAKYYNNCFMLRAEEDTRQDWAELSWKSESCLMVGGGIGVDYSVYRPKGALLGRTGGEASGPLPKMQMINEIGRNVMQGGSRRSAIYASLNWRHNDARAFLHAKDWHSMKVPGTDKTLWDVRQSDFNFPAPLDMTNISLNYDDAWLHEYDATGMYGEMFYANVEQACKTGEPGFAFNFGAQSNETLRNAPVAGDTQVLTSIGYQRVDAIIDTPVEVWTGQQWAHTTFKRTKENTPTVRVAFTGGSSIVCDPSHEFWVAHYSGAGKSRRRFSHIEKVRADQLTENDILYVSLPSLQSPEAFDAASYTLGFMYGDGHFRKQGGGELSLFGTKIPCGEFFDHTAFSSIKNNRYFVKTAWTPWRDKQVFPVNEYNTSFIAGLFDSDGNYDSTTQRIRLSSMHRDFLVGVQRALETYGIQSGVNIGSAGAYKGTPTWMLVVMASSIRKFAELIPCKRLNIAADHYVPYRESTIRVLGVEEDKNQDVYCCDVGVEEHAFCANGVIISNCTELTSEDDSDCCNLGSVNMSRITSLTEMRDVVRAGTLFLLCGSHRSHVPYEKVERIRNKNRRLGLGLMGIHEWLMAKGYSYGMNSELERWLAVYEIESNTAAHVGANSLSCSVPKGVRAIAPTGTIGILAGTTTGIEPLYAVAYKRRVLTRGTEWVEKYVIDDAARVLIDDKGVDPDSIETSLDLARDPERRIKFQYEVQKYVDHAISSTINLPQWGSDHNNPDTVGQMAGLLAKYAHGLRGFTAYPDAARGGQPLTAVSYWDALEHNANVETHDICEIGSKGGVCGA